MYNWLKEVFYVPKEVSQFAKKSLFEFHSFKI